MTLTTIQNNIVPVFVAYEVHDEYGRNKSVLSLHRTKADAEVAARNKGWYGGPGDVQMKHAIEDGLDLYLLADFRPTCYADVTELRERQRQRAVEAALAKLTPEEIEALKGEFK
ncbi:hypothetical protein phiPsa374_151 [Pseudomonas phage phiPsa374]|nr:hypothetical protein CF96_gp069 [Pseudomonas phage phiPsa374]AHJ87411.1 hypothetical protein phiPsa374_151 [Pseudomonas phage phiPsa374]